MSCANERNNTFPEKTTVFIENKEYVFNSSWIERLKNVNTEVTEEYIKSLLDYLGIIAPTESPISISHLLRHDYYNKRLFNSNGGTTICQYDYDGNLIREYTCINELLDLNSTKNFLFALKCKQNDGIVPKKQKVAFFQTEITPMFTEKSWHYSYITTLNLWMKDFVDSGNAEYKLKRYNESEFCEIARKYYSFEEYLSKTKKAFLFTLGETMLNSFYLKHKQKNTERKETLAEKEYNEQLDKLLKRYTHNDISLFQKVESLNDFKSQIGIYVMCLPEVKGFYVGKTINSLKKRIINHWVSQKSDFDKYYGHCDVTDIYVMCCNGLDNDTINKLEIDCITTIDRIFGLNVMVGENYIISLHDDKYNPEDFLLSNEFLTKIKEDLAKIKIAI